MAALLDLGRGNAASGTFKRPMQEYYNRFQKIIDRGFKMVIFMPKEFEAHLRLDYSRIKVIHFEAGALRSYFPYWDRVEAIRASKLWEKQAEYVGYLKTAPQNKLKGVSLSLCPSVSLPLCLSLRTMSLLFTPQLVVLLFVVCFPAGYNPLVMSKVMLLRDAAEGNYFRTKYHMWLDAGCVCLLGGASRHIPPPPLFFTRRCCCPPQPFLRL